MKKLDISFSKYFSSLRYGSQLKPIRDWSILLLIASILIAVSIAWNTWLFFETVNGKEIGPSTQAVTTPNVIPSAAITNVQNVFKARAIEEANYENTYHFVDPSVVGS